MNMNEAEIKRIVVNHIIAHLNPVPAGAVNDLLQQSLPDLEIILDKLATTRDQAQAEETAAAHIEEMRRASRADAAWVNVLRNVSLNGKRLVDAESNRNILESLLNPGEEPSPAIYKTLALTYPSKLSWEMPRPVRTDADREAEFVKTCHDNLLSLCDANRKLHKDGVTLDAWVGASGIERNQYANEAAQARQKFLINTATPSELRNEARFQSATEREEFQRAEAARQHQAVLQQQQQSGIYPPLPAADENGNVIDSRYIKKLSTIDFPRFRAMVKRFGSGSVTQRLRGDN